MAKVVMERYLYSEFVYYDDNDNEIARERQYDDMFWYQDTRDMTDEEREEFELDDNEEDS